MQTVKKIEIITADNTHSLENRVNRHLAEQSQVVHKISIQSVTETFHVATLITYAIDKY